MPSQQAATPGVPSRQTRYDCSWVETQLAREPLVETRNRKRLRPNPIAPWELRVRDMRVFYEVDEPGVVTVFAIGTKRSNRLYIEGEEIEL